MCACARRSWGLHQGKNRAKIYYCTHTPYYLFWKHHGLFCTCAKLQSLSSPCHCHVSVVALSGGQKWSVGWPSYLMSINWHAAVFQTPLKKPVTCHHEYGFLVGKNIYTRTCTCDKTCVKPVGIPVPVICAHYLGNMYMHDIHEINILEQIWHLNNENVKSQAGVENRPTTSLLGAWRDNMSSRLYCILALEKGINDFWLQVLETHNVAQLEMPKMPKQVQRPQCCLQYAAVHEWSEGILASDQVRTDNIS